MSQKRTDKELLVKGVQYMGIALALMFIGPTLLHVVLGNKEKPFYYILLTIAIVICLLAIFFTFKGLKKLMDSLFN